MRGGDGNEALHGDPAGSGTIAEVSVSKEKEGGSSGEGRSGGVRCGGRGRRGELGGLAGPDVDMDDDVGGSPGSGGDHGGRRAGGELSSILVMMLVLRVGRSCVTLAGSEHDE